MVDECNKSAMETAPEHSPLETPFLCSALQLQLTYLLLACRGCIGDE